MTLLASLEHWPPPKSVDYTFYWVTVMIAALVFLIIHVRTRIAGRIKPQEITVGYILIMIWLLAILLSITPNLPDAFSCSLMITLILSGPTSGILGILIPLRYWKSSDVTHGTLLIYSICAILVFALTVSLSIPAIT